MACCIVGRGRHFTSIRQFRGRILSQKLVAATRKRYLSEDKPISRFPIPILDTLPKDIQETMRKVEEKVHYTNE